MGEAAEGESAPRPTPRHTGAAIICWVAFGYAMRGSFLGCGLATVQRFVWLAFLVVRILAIVKGVGGQRFRIPVITDFAEKM